MKPAINYHAYIRTYLVLVDRGVNCEQRYFYKKISISLGLQCNVEVFSMTTSLSAITVVRKLDIHMNLVAMMDT